MHKGNMEEHEEVKGMKTQNGRVKRTADWWAKQKSIPGRRTSGRIVQQPKPTTTTENSQVHLQIRQGDKPTVLHIVKTKLPPGAKRLVNNTIEDNQKLHNGNKPKSKIECVLPPNVNNINSKVNNHIKTKLIVMISNLALDVTKEQLEEHFRKTGGIKNIHIPKEKGEEFGKGIAFIEFKNRISHGIALRLHHTTMGGKRINVEFSQSMKVNGKFK